MAPSARGPRYNLKAVVRQTGVKPDTLRAWERRYGLPEPDRSEGHHRLYSQHDIQTIQWLAARQEEGLSISRAVELWRELEARGRDPLQERPSVAEPPPPVGMRAERPAVAGDTLVQLRQGWLAACLAFDEQRAEQILTQAFALYPPETVCLELLRRAMAEIGDGWYQGETTVQQEHFASALAIRRLEVLIMASPPATRPGRILIANPPQEQHILGLLLLTYLLRRRGWEVVYLGADVPVEQMETTVKMAAPRLLILAAQRLPAAASLLDLVRALMPTSVPLAYGGLIFNRIPGLRARISGHFLGERIESASDMVEALMANPRPGPEVLALPGAYRQAREHLQEVQGIIEAQVIELLRGTDISARVLAHANRELGQNIDAALALGDIELLSSDLEWLEGMLRSHGLPPDHLPAYLRVYHQVARERLDERGDMVVRWLGRQAGAH